MVQSLCVPAQDLFGPVRLFSDATNLLVPAMERAGVDRLIAVTGFGVGDSRDAIGPLQRGSFTGHPHRDPETGETLAIAYDGRI